MKLYIGLFTIFVAIVISSVAAYFSIVGLAALFAAAGMSIIVMGVSLEVGKLVASVWLKLAWDDRSVNILHKGYLLIAILMLMVITSLGIYGFLAAGHLEQSAPVQGIAIQSESFTVQLAQKEQENKRLEGRLAQIDQNIAVFLTNDQASKGLRASRTLKIERETIQKQITNNYNEINRLNEKLVPLKMKSNQVEAKLGPVKYLAALFGWNDPEVAVRLVILIIMIAFDPLAVVLVISGMISLKQWAESVKPVVEESPKSRIEAHGREEIFEEPVPEVIETVIKPAIEETPEPEIEYIEREPIQISLSGLVEPVTEKVPMYIPTVDAGMSYPKAIAEVMGDVEIGTQAYATTRSKRDIILDMMEQSPEIITEVIEAAKEFERSREPENNKEQN